VGSHADDASAGTGVGSTLTIFEEEVHAARRPDHAPIALAHSPNVPNLTRQSVDDQVKALHIFKTLLIDD
jgi:hypothetical protein